MNVEQISIFLENKPGRMAAVTRLFAEGGINVRALALADTSEFGVLRLIVSDNEKAQRLLKDHGYTVGVTQVVAAEVEDRPGGLHRILSALARAEINVEYMYAFVRQSGENAIMIFRFDNIPAACAVLQKEGVRIIDGQVLYQM